MRLSRRRLAPFIASMAFSGLCAISACLVYAVEIPLNLSGETEVPKVESRARGIGVITVGEDGAISGRITTSGLVGISAQLHDGTVDDRGPVVVSLEKSGESWTIPQGTRLTSEQLASLRAGKLYINVHSTTHRDGEIRGQLLYPGRP